MSRLRAAWARIERLKRTVGEERPSRGSVAETYAAGEAWVRVVLDEAGVGSEREIDEFAALEATNAQATLKNLLLQFDREQLYQVGLLAGLARPGDPHAAVERAVLLRLMHSSGFSNGLALGLLVRLERSNTSS